MSLVVYLFVLTDDGSNDVVNTTVVIKNINSIDVAVFEKADNINTR